MDLDLAEMPPIPARSHHHHHLHHHRHNSRGLQPSSASASVSASNPTSAPRTALPATSPEIISNLITSLSIIAQPANPYFDSISTASSNLSVPTSPSVGASPATSPGLFSGSFGVDYGAFSLPLGDDQQKGGVSLDDGACPPVVRTSKPPSGYTSLTAPRSPRSHRSPSRESGLRSFIRSSANTSRPSSKGSLGSKNDDTQSIGNVSIERGSAPTPELKLRRSHDSWGRRTSRGSKNLMYMTSKERLRDRDFDKKRFSSTSMAGSMAGSMLGGASSINSGDPFLSEKVINEEPRASTEIMVGDRGMDSPRLIPARDSSLRKTGSSRKRSSGRRSKRESDEPGVDAILESEEFSRSREEPGPGHWRSNSDASKLLMFELGEYYAPKRIGPSGRMGEDGSYRLEDRLDELEEDGAPFPAVSQGPRRDEYSTDRSSSRLSGRMSPGAHDVIRPKRSNSRLKRLSIPISPRSDRQSTDEPALQSPMPVGYERPLSADSVDDAVESYLCSPRLSQKIRHPQTGRVISFSEVGDAEGSAVFCCVGMGLTRYITAFYDELALTLKLRLITPDRPGVGDSESYADGTTVPLSWPGKHVFGRECLRQC